MRLSESAPPRPADHSSPQAAVTEAVSKYKAKTDGCTSLNKTVAWARESKGIHISCCTLDDARKSGKAPLKRGKNRTAVVPEKVEKHLYETVVAARAQNLPVFKELVIGNLMLWLEGTVEEEAHFSKEGVLSMSKFNNWYYSWLKDYQLNTEAVKPIEVERATWTTPANLLKHYAVIEKVAIERGYGITNKDYDESGPDSPRLLWTKLERVFSFDEKKLTLDQNAKNKSNTNRTMTVPAMGDTGKCVAGRAGWLLLVRFSMLSFCEMGPFWACSKYDFSIQIRTDSGRLTEDRVVGRVACCAAVAPQSLHCVGYDCPALSACSSMLPGHARSMGGGVRRNGVGRCFRLGVR